MGTAKPGVKGSIVLITLSSEAGGLSHQAQWRRGEGGDGDALAAGGDDDAGVGCGVVGNADEDALGAVALVGEPERRSMKARFDPITVHPTDPQIRHVRHEPAFCAAT